MRTPPYIGRFISALGMGSGVFILLISWRVRLNSENVAAENAMLRKAIGTPLIIRNLEIDILPYLMPVSPPEQPQSNGAEKVMLFARDTCSYCLQQIPMWKDLLGSVVLDKDAEVWLISLGRADAFRDVAGFLAGKGRSYREFRVPAVEVFALCTGIRGVPTTIITQNNRVRLVYAGIFTQRIQEQIIPRVLAEPLSQATFPGVGRTEAIVE